MTIALLSLGAAALVVSSGTVFAHADYDRSEPNKDEVVLEPPERLDVWFTQELFKREGDNFIRVFNEAGEQVSEGDGIVDDDDRTHMHTMLDPDLADGRYIVEWKTLSDEDGDREEGAFCFYIGVEPAQEQEAECAELAGDDEETPTPLPTELEETAETPAGTAEDASAGGGDEDDDGGVPAVAIVIGVIAGVVVLGGVAGGAVILVRRSLG